MTNKTIENARSVGGDYFSLIYVRSSKKTLDYFIPLFNFDDYYCLKSTRHQQLITYQEFLQLKHSRYIFFKKSQYDIEQIFEWINYFKSIGGIQYLSKPTPPFSATKIIIRK